MKSFNELTALYNSYKSFTPVYSASLNDYTLLLISITTLFFLMITFNFNAKTSSFTKSIFNFILYTILAAISAISLSFTVLFISSHFGVYT
ncbi:hypothetical protein DAPK24_010210 [Pichia kluyveri]|uniref:Dolichyl-diphosphooligosaccharide-protein glycosyltransferase subunit OST5 n=1 Tax=Pichia kluyveri TaxID=36015 RepID=A0AAV5QYY4_PICKL|nr:hypothetical protein DAPK24_010210 [Pichia kluyveri]